MNYSIFSHKSESVAFTGHRFIPYDQYPSVRETVKQTVLELYHRGYKYYYCGMAMGFDMLAAEAVIFLKAEYKDIKLIASVPYRNQSEKFTYVDKRRYQAILNRADEVVVLSEDYKKDCFLERNNFMLAHASSLIAYYDGKEKGGTFYTVCRAERKGISVRNII